MRHKHIHFLFFFVIGVFVSIPVFTRAEDSDRDGLPDDWQTSHGFSTNGFAAKLTGWWQMDDTSHTNVLDRSSHDLTGALSQFSTFPFSPGIFGTALDFTPHSRVKFDSANPWWALPQSFTISAWYLGSNSTTFTTLAHWMDVQGNNWRLGVSPKGISQFQFEAAGQPVQSVEGGNNAWNVNDRQWHHIAGVFDSQQAEAILYVDGATEAVRLITRWNPGSPLAFSLGNLNPDLSINRFTLDETRLYHSALSSSEILELPATYSDPDGDGLPNLSEWIYKLNPLNADSDSDGIPDGADAHPLEPEHSKKSGNAVTPSFKLDVPIR